MKTYLNRIYGGAAACLAILLCGCAAQSAPQTGFLGEEPEYAQLRPVRGEDFLMYRKNPGVLKGYSSFVVEPVLVLAPSGRILGPDERELRNLGEDFRREVIHALGNKVSVVGGSSIGVARIRIALTDAVPNRALVNLTSARLTGGLGVGNAAMEAEIIDTVSNERLVAIVGRSKDENSDYFENLSRWQGAHAAFAAWADDLKRALTVAGSPS